MNEEIESWGHAGKTIILRSDQEGPIEVVKRGLAEIRVGESLIEDTPKGESSANGRGEDAGKRSRDQARVVKDQVEWKGNGILDIKGDAMRWLVRWASMILTRYHKGKYNKTPWERMHGGEACSLEVVPWGERVWYKKLKDGGKDNKMDSRWEEGIWLGHMGRSAEVVIGTAEGCVRGWSIRRRPEGERWDIDAINGIKGTPEEPIPGQGTKKPPIVIRLEVNENEGLGAEFDFKVEAPKKAYIKRRWYEEHGFQEGCKGCKAMKMNHGSQGHNSSCRERMEGHMGKTPDGKKLLDEAKRK